ncbi:DUF3987 domain-containing protein [Comamonas thiooxydans]|uniref:DUF3987 domain-containing protein n=1 Tax=Comamonas thiooxydans TaxID=363952 RepID=UPI0006A8BDB0|nr:DUF3987 domain-containing protein [Comamonas thiooxydans]CUB01600.1 Protein of unknown function (DUF3987) [Comamonas thiooxydans]
MSILKEGQLFYPTESLPPMMRDFIYCVMHATQANEALVGPVVISVASAAVQGVADVLTPFGTDMPTSLFTGVVALSGDRKSTVLKLACRGMEEFERGMEGYVDPEMSFRAWGSHPFLVEEATEKGVVDVYAKGAKSLFYALDEGGMLTRNLDVPALCKRFDGADIRNFSRTRGATYVADTRGALCMLVQDLTFSRMMKGDKGAYLIESGLLPRMLMSFASMPVALPPAPCSMNIHNHEFHERIRALMRDYKELFMQGLPRDKMCLAADAEHLWKQALGEWEALLQDGMWQSIRPFVRRAGEQALRMAGVLQWFTAPQEMIEHKSMETAIDVVHWHLLQARTGFGKLPQEALQQELARTLYDYLMRRAVKYNATATPRNTLIRGAPLSLRKADQLDMALDQLELEGKVGFYPMNTRKNVVLTAASIAAMNPKT